MALTLIKKPIMPWYTSKTVNLCFIRGRCKGR